MWVSPQYCASGTFKDSRALPEPAMNGTLDSQPWQTTLAGLGPLQCCPTCPCMQARGLAHAAAAPARLAVLHDLHNKMVDTGWGVRPP